MIRIRVLVVFAMACALLGSGAAVQAAKGAKKGIHAVHGVVTAVSNARGIESITVQVHPKKKKHKAAGANKTHKFHVTAATLFVKGHGKKGIGPAAFHEVKPGRHVTILPQGGKSHEAQLVKLDGHKHKKNKARKLKP